MTAVALEQKLYTIEEYLEMEETSKEKHEYYNGKIRLIPGGSITHNLIAASITTALSNAVENLSKNYLILNSDTKIFISRTETFAYPDAVVVCEKI